MLAEIENGDLERNDKIAEESEKIAKTQFERADSLLKYGISSKNASEEKKSHLLDMLSLQWKMVKFTPLSMEPLAFLNLKMERRIMTLTHLA